MDWSDCAKAVFDVFSYAGTFFQKRDSRAMRKIARESVEVFKLGQQVNTLKDVLDAREAAGKNIQNVRTRNYH